MSAFTTPRSNTTPFTQPGAGAVLKYLERYGRLPPVTLSSYSLESPGTEVSVAKFISYSFKSSILSPVDEFSCQVHYDPTSNPIVPHSQEGDIFALKANGLPLGSGIIDQTEVETDANMGTTLHITGRNFLGQWEDQDAVNINSAPFYSGNATVQLVAKILCQDTRINPAHLVTQFAPAKPYLFATQPGETKLASMQRYCEALDIYFWMLGDGTLKIGRPDMYGTINGNMGTLYMKAAARKTNVLSIRSVRASTQIPNVIVPLWNGQEIVQDRASVKQNAICNGSPGPQRLYRYGHRVPKALVYSSPQGDSPQDLAAVNEMTVAQQNASQQKKTTAGGANLLQAMAKRELARANIKEVQVQIQVAGHYNDSLLPYMPDQVYRIQYDADNIDQDMYLYEVEYFLDEQGSQRSRLFFCPQTAIVADAKVFYAP